MHRNKRAFSRAESWFSKSEWIVAKYSARKVYAPMWPIPGWLLAIKHLKPHQSEHPSIQCTAFAKRTMVACRRIFPSLSFPYPILTRQPLPSNHFLTRPNWLSVSMSKYFALRISPAFYFFSFSFHFIFGLNSSNFHNWSLALQITASCHILDLNVLVLNKPYLLLLSFTVGPGWT